MFRQVTEIAEKLGLDRSEVLRRLREDEFEYMSNDDLESLYDDSLDSESLVNIAGLEYNVSHALKLVDPTAYRCGLSDYIDTLLTDDILIELGGDYYQVKG